MNKTYLKELEDRSIFIIREAAAQFKNPAILWSVGKDSTVLLWLFRKSFSGRIPFPVIHIDTGFKFPQMYRFRDRMANRLKINLIIAKNTAAIKAGTSPEKSGRFQCCTKLKTDALKRCLEQRNFDAVFLAIRRDEHGIRAKERYFSPRDKEFKWDYKNQPPEIWDLFRGIFKHGMHYRVHPMLHWTELDIWEYTKQEKIPVNPLYFSSKGKRYRSLGCAPCTVPADSKAKSIDEIIKELQGTSASERSGRAQDKEKAYMMQKLRSLGYM